MLAPSVILAKVPCDTVNYLGSRFAGTRCLGHPSFLGCPSFLVLVELVLVNFLSVRGFLWSPFLEILLEL